MFNIKNLIFTITTFFYGFNLQAKQLEVPSYDVLVIGGTPAGVAAAIGAARLGKTVMVIEQSPVLGGVLSSGVIRLDDYYSEANSGVIESFRKSVKAYHRSELAEDPLVKKHLESPDKPWNTAHGRAWEPHTAARIFGELLAEEESARVRFNEVAIDVMMEGDRVIGVVTCDRNNQGQLGKEHRYRAKIIIDATYEADLAEYASIPYRIGREARSELEPHAGNIYTTFFGAPHNSLTHTILPGGTGMGDHRSQAFTYRMTAKDYGTPDHPYRLKEPPPNYDPKKYRWHKGTTPIIPNKKFDMLGINWGGDLTGHGTKWVLADWEERREIEKVYRNYELGWLYYIQNKGGSPNIGLPDDEFTDNENFPYRLYVRQGRRIEGLYTLTESDLHKDLKGDGLRGPLHSDSVAIGLYGIDAHHVQSPNHKKANFLRGRAEGTLYLSDSTGPYQIPYGVMVPKTHKGILFPVGISSTHVAMCSFRMEPVWSALGQAAGVAAALAIDGNKDLSKISLNDLQDALLQQACMLYFYTDLNADRDGFEAVQKLSLLGAFKENYPLRRPNWNGPIDGLGNVANKVSYRFRPDELITLGEFARLVIKGCQIPVSITASHFNDVPRGHPYFKYIETLYDYSTQSINPFFDYKVQSASKKSYRVFAQPDEPIRRAQAIKILSGLLKKPIPSLSDPESTITRIQAAKILLPYIENQR